MITSAFLTFLSNFLTGLTNLLPTGHISSSILDSVTYFWGVGNSFSYIIPMDTLLSAVLLVVTFEGLLLLWSIIGWIIRKIPGMS